ncbi:MAG: NUDIX hydrolase [Lachnospiraceae bacterium]|nr:NUDIX hydrolase [Lachnospiraceae bacterium]
MEKLERLNRELMYKGAIIDLYKDTIKTPDGNIEYYDFIKHQGAAAVIPIRDDGKILMVKQYRNALDRFTIEIPAGGLASPNEPTKDAAARELEEETGYHSDDLELLLTIRTTIAFCNEKIDVYVATNLVKTEQHLDEGEYVDVLEFELEELVKMVFDGTIEDSKTINAILALDKVYNKK